MCFHKVRRGIGAASSWLHRLVRWQAWLEGPPPTLPKVDKIDGPCDRIEAENRKRDLSPVATQREEPAARLTLTREVFSLLNSYYDFASSVPLFQICDCGRDLTQLISPINDRFHLYRLHEIG